MENSSHESLLLFFSVIPHGGGGGGFTRPIPGDGGADQLRGVSVIGRFPTDGTKGLEVRGVVEYGPTQMVQYRAVKHEM